MSKPSDNELDPTFLQLVHADREAPDNPKKAWANDLRELHAALHGDGWGDERVLLDIADWLDGKKRLPRGRPERTREQRAKPNQTELIRADFKALKKHGVSAKDAKEQLQKKYFVIEQTINYALSRASGRIKKP